MSELKAPYGLNEEGELVSSDRASRGANYYCQHVEAGWFIEQARKMPCISLAYLEKIVHLKQLPIKSQSLKVVSGAEAVSEFYKVLNRNFPKL